jgi:hypothetical protein
MGVERFLAHAELLRQIIHGHAAEAMIEKVDPCGINDSLPVRIPLSASLRRSAWAFHVCGILSQVWKLIQYI